MRLTWAASRVGLGELLPSRMQLEFFELPRQAQQVGFSQYSSSRRPDLLLVRAQLLNEVHKHGFPL